MTSQERLLELDTMRKVFESKDTTDERRAEILTKMQGWAEEEMPESRCVDCKRGGVYAPYTHALIPGHCYSYDGMVDYTRITKMCEFCFDNLPRHEDEG